MFTLGTPLVSAQIDLRHQFEAARSKPDPNEIKVYPNPATDYIGLSEAKEVKRIVIINLVGRQMKTFQVGGEGARYYVGDLPRGMYLVQLLDAQKEVVTTKRVSKR